MRLEVEYNKASVERKPEYRQTTVILRDGDKRFVRKMPVGNEAKEHVRKYAERYQELDQALINRDEISIVPCTENPDGSVDFPFCSFPTLSDRLKNLPTEEYAAEIVLFRDKLKKAFGFASFEKTEGFTAVFGEDVEIREEDALNFTNLDMNFDNVFLQEDGRCALIDYEWVLPFPVPLNYMVFRSFISDTTFASFSETDRISILEKLGIDEEKQKVFWEMEYAFQRYVASDEEKLQNFGSKNQDLLPEKTDIRVLSEENKKQKSALAEYKRAYDDQQAAIQALNSQIDEYKKAYDDQQEAIQTLNGQIKEYKKAYDDQQTAIHTLDSQLNEYKKAYDDQQTAIHTLDGQLDEYKKAYDDQQAAIQTLNGRVEEYKHAYEESKTELEQLKSQWWCKIFLRASKKPEGK